MALNPETIAGELTEFSLGIGDSTGNGTGVDISDFIGKILITVNTSATTGTFAFQTSAISGSAYAAFDPAISVGAGAGLHTVEIDTRVANNFIRVVRGGTMNGEFSVVGVGKKQDKA